MNTAIIVAAGTGSRFGSERPKQFVEILGKPVIIHTIERFEECDAIDEMVLVLNANEIDNFQQFLTQYNFRKVVKLISGGVTRAESVRNGLDAVATATNIVAVHDGARPFVSVDEIRQTIEKATETGAACLVAEVIDTIKEIDGKNISRTIDRSKLRRALTPQAFGYELLLRAFDGVDLGESITDECCLVEKLGVKIAFVEGSTRNIKITTPDDLIFAAALSEASA